MTIRNKKEMKGRCEECGSTMTYIRLRTNEKACRKCGHIQALSNKKK